ncbi:alpha/beta fold hydrolase [Halotia branconii]|uniref:Alpha/beta hydrolase n=1 Tax=Halotia branconii CENA392 TaxID=1539056 RepID=A0AAJ6PAG4_9CYAN|nr:alpha/beta hydrolase [Halotia branconii]WGV26849.1 alpha/beta hydrolase [Halotia branconii CENA392]
MTQIINSNTVDFDRQFQHQTAEVNGVRIHYVMGGKGEAVVLLHGFPQTWYEWHKVMPALAEKYTVIAPDLRGLGESSCPAPDYQAQSVAEDIHQLVQKLDFKQINLVAHDIAGAAAYSYAVQYPQEILRLVFMETLVPGFNADTTGQTGNYWHMGFHMTPDLPEQLITGKEHEYLTFFIRNFAHRQDMISEEEISKYVNAYSAPGALHAAFEYYRVMPKDAEQNKRDFKTKLKMPILALGGEKSLRDLPLTSLQLVAEDVRGGSIPHCGHWLATECPDDFTQQLLTFFSDKN